MTKLTALVFLCLAIFSGASAFSFKDESTIRAEPRDPLLVRRGKILDQIKKNVAARHDRVVKNVAARQDRVQKNVAQRNDKVAKNVSQRNSKVAKNVANREDRRQDKVIERHTAKKNGEGSNLQKAGQYALKGMSLVGCKSLNLLPAGGQVASAACSLGADAGDKVIGMQSKQNKAGDIVNMPDGPAKRRAEKQLKQGSRQGRLTKASIKPHRR